MSPTFMFCVRDKGTLSPTLSVTISRWSRWFVSATFVICVHDIPRGEVLVDIGVMELGLLSRTQVMTDESYNRS